MRVFVCVCVCIFSGTGANTYPTNITSTLFPTKSYKLDLNKICITGVKNPVMHTVVSCLNVCLFDCLLLKNQVRFRMQTIQNSA